jgi:hypothetical protein
VPLNKTVFSAASFEPSGGSGLQGFALGWYRSGLWPSLPCAGSQDRDRWAGQGGLRGNRRAKYRNPSLHTFLWVRQARLMDGEAVMSGVPDGPCALFHFPTAIHNGCTSSAPCSASDGGLVSIDAHSTTDAPSTTKVAERNSGRRGSRAWLRPGWELRNPAVFDGFRRIPQQFSGDFHLHLCNSTETWVFAKATQYLVLYT